MPAFVPVSDPEKARYEQDEKEMAKHRNFDSMVVARQRTETTNRGWEQGSVGWGVLGAWGSSCRDEKAQVTRRVADPNKKMVRNEKGLWVKARDLDPDISSKAAYAKRGDQLRQERLGAAQHDVRVRNDDDRDKRRREENDQDHAQDDRERTRRDDNKHDSTGLRADMEDRRRSRRDDSGKEEHVAHRRDDVRRRVRRDKYEDYDRQRRRRRQEDDGDDHARRRRRYSNHDIDRQRQHRRRDGDEYGDDRLRDKIEREELDGGSDTASNKRIYERNVGFRDSERKTEGLRPSNEIASEPDIDTAPADFAFSCSQLVDRVLEVFNSDAPPSVLAAALGSCFDQAFIVAPLRQGDRPPAMSGRRALEAVTTASARVELAEPKLRIFMEPGGGEKGSDEVTFCLDVYPANQAPGLSAVVKGSPADTFVLWRAHRNKLTHAFVAPERSGFGTDWSAVSEQMLMNSRAITAANELLAADLPSNREYWEFYFNNYTTDIDLIGVA